VSFVILIEAHDAVWCDKRVSLKERIRICDMLWRLAIAAAQGGTE
jgi:hypothetical protein